jgi:AMP deaminase
VVGGGRESDDEEEARSIPNDTDSEPLDEPNNDAPAEAGSFSDNLQEGMLPRDMPQRTAFYDPVAERQMSQTDAKLFYQRSQIDLHKPGGTFWSSQASPMESPVITIGAGLRDVSSDNDYESLLGINSNHVSFASAPAAAQMELPEPSSMASEKTIPAGQVNSHVHGSIGPTNSLVSGAPLEATIFQNPAFSGGAGSIGGSNAFDAEPHINTELCSISRNIDKILGVRRQYMSISLQLDGDNPKDQPAWPIYPPPPEPAWAARDKTAGAQNSVANSLSNSLLLQQDAPQQAEAQTQAQSSPAKKRKPGQDIGSDFDMDHCFPLPKASQMMFKMDDNGVYQVFRDGDEAEPSSPVQIPTLKEFYMDLDEILSTSSDGPSKSFAFRRLQYLEGKFNLYVLLNEYQETADSKKVPHRDFYNVRKVDTHVHHSACMNQKHLLRFIKSKMKKYPDEVVLHRDGKHLTLAEVFESINLTAYDLSIDTLDMHVSSRRLLCDGA